MPIHRSREIMAKPFAGVIATDSVAERSHAQPRACFEPFVDVAQEPAAAFAMQ
jgi:hypothetical protein